MAVIMKKEQDGEHPASHYLVVEDPDKPSTWHLRVKDADGKLDHRLMGQAWAALHEGFRGNTYEGPDKAKAIAKLKRLYEEEEMDLPTKSLTLTERSVLVEWAVQKLSDAFSGSAAWPVAVYDDSVVIQLDSDGSLYRAAYTLGDDGVELAPREQWEPVEREYVPVKSLDDTLVMWGDAVKALGDGRVGGYLVRFGGPDDRDLDGEFFTEKTYYGARDGDGVDCMFDHGFPVKADLRQLADHLFAPIKTRRDELGIWAETVLNVADEYERIVYELAQAGKLGWSSGAAGHTVRKRASGEITRWIIAEGSLTHTPAEPRNRVVALKSLIPAGSGPVDDRNKQAQEEFAGQTPNEPEAAPEAHEVRGEAARTLQLRAKAYLYLTED